VFQQGPPASDPIQQANQALAGRDVAGALALLDRADAGGFTVASGMTRALALRLGGDLPGAVAVLDRVLAVDPYEFMALLSKGAILEMMGKPRLAVGVYRNALKIAPPESRCPPPLVAQIGKARDLVAAEAARLRDHLRDAVADLRGQCGSEDGDRFDESLDVFAGFSPPVKQEPLLLNYARLPAISFYDRAHFPWLTQLEAGTDMIVAELKAFLADPGEAFAPYIAFPRGVPVNQWKDLNHSEDWSAAFLWKDGVKQDGACERCPGTTALLESLPMAMQEGYAPTVTFSALKPRTHIPPHTGSSNIRLLTHLPLILPGPARFRVGNTTRDWEMGQAWVFDDTIEHEAWNDADQMRVILIFDVWNPFLTDAEKALITAMLNAQRDYLTAG